MTQGLLFDEASEEKLDKSFKSVWRHLEHHAAQKIPGCVRLEIFIDEHGQIARCKVGDTADDMPA